MFINYLNYTISIKQMKNVSNQDVNQIVRLIKQKYISPYKIIYMVDQKQADYFKQRNKTQGCCTSAEITIPYNQRSKIERQLSQLITPSAIRNSLEQILSYCQDRYKNICQKGTKDGLKITNQVEKYLVDSILAEHINSYIHDKLVKILCQRSKAINSQIGLWATPATWIAKYPHIKLQLLSPNNLSQLFNLGYTILQNKFPQMLKSCEDQLTLLQKDGKFQQVLCRSQNIQKQQSNCYKMIRNLIPFSQIKDSNQNKVFRNIQSLCVKIQSIPFQLNMKANQYLTVSSMIQACFYKQNAKQIKKKNYNCKFSALICVNEDLMLEIGDDKMIKLQAGNLLLISNQLTHGYKSMNKYKKNIFLIRNFIDQVTKQK